MIENKMCLGLFIAAIALPLGSLHAQSDSVKHSKENITPPASQFSRNVSFGAVGGANLNEHFTNFQSLPGVPDCSPTYQHGIGVGGTVGAVANFPLSTNFAFGLRGVYALDGGLLQANEPTSISVAGVATGANIQHTIQTTLGMIDLEPTVSYNLFGGLRAYAGVGVGYLVSATFDQKETLTEPTNTGSFTNGSRTRNEVTGKLPNAASIVESIVGGVNYELPLNASGTLHALPELGLTDWLSSPVKGLPWNVFNFRGAVAVMYTIPDAPPPVVAPPPVAPPPPVVPKKPELIVSVSAAGLDPDGVEHPNAAVKVEEIYETRTSPLVPYIFFDEKSSLIPERYAKLQSENTAGFSAAKLYALDRLSLYRQMLNIVGSRLVANPTTSITLTGCNASGATAQNSKQLSKARAESVRDYLASVWGISQGRMKIRVRDLPQNASPQEDSDGIQENRRVEIASASPEILSPLTLADTVRDATPPTIRFHPSVESEAGILDWELTTGQNGHDLKTFQGSGMPPKNVDWDLNQDQKHVPRAPGKLGYALLAHDSVGSESSAHNSIQIEQFTLTKKKRELADNAELEHYSVLLFNFKSAELSSGDKKLIEYIKGRITPSASVTVEGYCDRIGNAEANHDLAELRAHTVAQLLGDQAIEARGSNELLYDNSTPEGRFYSRTVEVTIKTPLGREQ